MKRGGRDLNKHKHSDSYSGELYAINRAVAVAHEYVGFFKENTIKVSADIFGICQ
jgi:hypothetical protein